jgi:hypothetical protein
MGMTMKLSEEQFAMCFLIAAAALVAALVAGALIAPRPFRHLTLRVDACPVGAADWGIIDPGCADLRIGAMRVRRAIDPSAIGRQAGSTPAV